MTSASRAHRHEIWPLREMHKNGNVQTIFKITQAGRTQVSEAACMAGFEGIREWDTLLRRGGLCQEGRELSPQNLSHGGTKEQCGGSQGQFALPTT